MQVQNIHVYPKISSQTSHIYSMTSLSYTLDKQTLEVPLESESEHIKTWIFNNQTYTSLVEAFNLYLTKVIDPIL